MKLTDKNTQESLLSADNKLKTITLANQKAWDASAQHHRRSEEWQSQIKGFVKPGYTTFDPTMTNLLHQVGVKGKRVVQVGCNNGREIASAVSLGASVAHGIDQSAQFLEQAAELKALVDNWSDSQCEFTCSDIYDLPATVPNDFDLCFITIGVLNWMPDLPGFFRVVANLLASGGTVLIYETHPFLEMFEPKSENPSMPVYSYFKKTPYVSSEAITYDGSVSESNCPSYWFSYSIGTILNACMAANLSLTDFQEYPHSNREVDFDIYQNQTAQLPMCYSLIAQK